MSKSRIQTVDIISDLIAGIDTSIVIDQVDDLGSNQYKLHACNTSYINTAFTWEISPGINATVISFEHNKSITIEVIGFTPATGTIELPKPAFNHGTVRAVNAERDEIHQADGAKYPYIFMLERMNEAFNDNEENIVDRISPLKLYFLTNYNECDWQTAQHYDEIIRPLCNLREKFISLLKTSSFVNDEQTFDSEYSGTNYVRFGTYVENSGNIKSLMNEDVSGVSLEISVVFNKVLNCTLNCN